MTSENVLDLYNRFQANGIVVWIDGGWGVDAMMLGPMSTALSILTAGSIIWIERCEQI